MKKLIMFLFFTIVILLNSGCSETYKGLKIDSKDAWNATKESIHKATE